MAIYYFRNVGTDWNTSGNWSLTDGGTASLSVPLSTDTAYFSSNSGNCTVGTASITSVLFTGVGAGNYTGTFTVNNTLTTTGTISLSGSMSTAGPGILLMNGTQSMTSNGCIWVPNITIAGNSTKTFNDNLTINGNLTFGIGGSTTCTLAGATAGLNINLKGNLISTTLANATTAGTNVPTIIMNGTGTQSWIRNLASGGEFRTPLTISNSNASVVGTVFFSGSTLTTTTPVITTGSTLSCSSGAATTLDTNSCTWNNVVITGGTTCTFNSSMNVAGLLTLGKSVVSMTLALGSNNINARGDVFLNITSGVIVMPVGTTGSIILNGSATQSLSQLSQSGSGSLRVNLTISNSNTIISGIIGFTVATLTATTNAITSGSTLLLLGSCNLDVSPITWNIVNFSGSVTYTLLSDMTIGATCSVGNGTTGTTTLSAAVARTINIKSDLFINVTSGRIVGTNVTFVMNGSSRQTLSQVGQSGVGSLRANLTINNPLSVISGTVGFGNAVLNATTTATTTGSTLVVPVNTVTFNTSNLIIWNNLNFTAASTATLTSDLYVSGSLTVTAAPVFNGNSVYFGVLTLPGDFAITGSSNWVAFYGGNITSPFARFNISGTFSINTTGTVTILQGSQLAFTSGPNAGLSNSMNITYISGNVVFQQGSTFVIGTGVGSPTVNMPGIIFWNVTFIASSTNPITLNSDIIVDGGTFQLFSIGSVNIVINGTNRTIFCGRSIMANFLIATAGGSTLSGTAAFSIGGSGQSTWRATSAPVMVINNRITFNYNGLLSFYDISTSTNGYSLRLGNGTYTWLSGKVVSYDVNGRLGRGGSGITTSCTLIGFNRLVGFGNISVSSGSTLTMDKFFNGSPTAFLNVSSSSLVSPFTVTFLDRLEKLSNFVKVFNCNVTNRNQLLILNSKGNIGSNVGVRFSNTLPNGLPERENFGSVYPTGSTDISYLDGGLPNDPNIIFNF